MSSVSGKFNLLAEESWVISLSSFQAAPLYPFIKIQHSSCELMWADCLYLAVYQSNFTDYNLRVITDSRCPQPQNEMIHLLQADSDMFTATGTVFWYNLGQNSCVLGEYFSKLYLVAVGAWFFPPPFPWKQCCCVFKRKTHIWTFVGNNVELAEGGSFMQSRWFENSFVCQERIGLPKVVPINEKKVLK